jgi:transcriptional regulator with XRE-family HTH domain
MLEDATALHDFFAGNPSEPGSVRSALGPRIRRARVVRLRGLNLEEFGRMIAEEMGRSRPFSNVTISNWETGRQEPSFEALVAISRLTKLPLRYFAGVGEMEDYPEIDWLADGTCNVTQRVSELLGQLRRLPEWQRELVVSQLQALLGALHRLGPRT